MRILTWLLIFVFVTPLFAEDKKIGIKDSDSKKTDVKKVEKKKIEKKNSESIKVFEEKGIFSVDVPEKGFEWKKLQDIKSDKNSGAVYLCTSKKSKNSVILSSINLNAKTDNDRRDYIAGQFDGFKNDFEKGDGKIVEGDRPKLESKIPDHVSYSLKLQNADKSEFYQYITFYFGKNTFSIAAQSLKLSEAKTVNEKTVKSFKELDKDK